MPRKTHLPFSIFRRTGNRFFYVSFKNPKTGEYLPAISTRQETEKKAITQAFEWLKDGIPRRGEVIPLKKYSLRDMAREADVSPEDCLFICGELKRRGLLKSFVLAETPAAIPFADFLDNFWDYDNSPYIKEKLRKNHGIHKRYTAEMRATAGKYWLPFFAGKMLGEITRQDLEGFMSHIETYGGEAGAGPKSAKRKNGIVKAGTIALKWAYSKELIDKDIARGITFFSGKAAERLILTPELAAALFRVEWKDSRARLANMLAMVTGMRAGEIQGLRVEDLGQDCLYVRHSWNVIDGLKTTKNNESRRVEIPFPGLIQELIDLARRNPHRPRMAGYVFWAEKLPDKPMEQDIFRRELQAALLKIGLDKEAAKVYTFHGWRHYFTAYMRDRVNEKLLQSQTGHKSLSMLEHYAGHIISGDRERIRAAQQAAFGGLLPETTDYTDYGEGAAV
ncbi:MAG: site-specific integrase [Spirochaetales bacterium]|jgi:integrase|nr:site-specific integrase [Spirochaetales bacterium]